MTLMLATLLRPFLVVALFAVVVIPLELLLARIWPDGRLKAVLFDRTFRDRRPWAFGAVWLALMVLLWGSIYIAYRFY